MKARIDARTKKLGKPEISVDHINNIFAEHDANMHEKSQVFDAENLTSEQISSQIFDILQKIAQK